MILLKLTILDDRRSNHLSALCHKNIYNTQDASLKQLFIKVAETRARVTCQSNTMNMVVPDVRSTKGRMSIRYRGPKQWNSLSNELKSIEKHDSFKRMLNKTTVQVFDNHPT